MRDSSSLHRYGIAVIAIAAAIALRYALSPWLGMTFPLATMFTAIAFVVWRAGWGPALLTTIGGWLAGGIAFRGGFGYFGGLTFSEIIGFLTYLLATVPIIVLGESMRRAHRQLEQRHEELSSANLALESKVEAQSLLAAIVASSEDAIVSKTLDGIITSWNHGAERLFGWTAREVLGRSIHVIIPPELREHERGVLERLRRGERVEHRHVERLRKDGSRVHVSITISPVYDRHGHIIGASKTARDISDRAAWEQQLLRSEEAQRLLVAIHDATRGLEDPGTVMREIVTRVGLHFDVIRCAYGEVNETQDDLLISPGYTRGVPSVAGRYRLAVFGAALAESLKAGNTAVIEDVRTHPLTNTPEALAVYAGMNVVSMVCVPLVRAAKLVAILVMADNQPREWQAHEASLLEQVAVRTLFAVESARAAASLRESRDNLQLAVTERHRALEALQEADRRKDEFLATLAHELRNPLAPINAGLHILRSSHDAAQSKAALQIMERQVNQMVRLVDDLLDVARITTGKVEVKREPLDLAMPLNDAIETIHPAIDRADRFTIVLPAQPVYVNADRTRMAQVFANLLNNAVKYSEGNQPITITVDRDGDDAVMRVRDAGIGIDTEMLPRVFDMFRQADRAGARSRGGLGIGLSLVKRIVELHGGTVTAHSEGLGRGSEFIVRLAAIEPPSDVASATAPPYAAASPRRILVVDDNADAAESLATLLAISGHETRMAHDGKDAVKQAEQFNPDVVFLDIGMPVLDGHETARLIRQQPWGKDMVLIALTGWGQNEDRRRSQDAGFNHHLVKPADPDQVAKLLASI